MENASFLTAISGDHTSAGAAYAALGSATTEFALSMTITCTFDQPVWLSTDGTNDHIFVPSVASSGTAVVPVVIPINLSANRTTIDTPALGRYTQFYAKQGPDGAPTKGDIAISFVTAQQ